MVLVSQHHWQVLVNPLKCIGAHISRLIDFCLWKSSLEIVENKAYAHFCKFLDQADLSENKIHQINGCVGKKYVVWCNLKLSIKKWNSHHFFTPCIQCYHWCFCSSTIWTSRKCIWVSILGSCSRCVWQCHWHYGLCIANQFCFNNWWKRIRFKRW